jgi:hypothetical protein
LEIFWGKLVIFWVKKMIEKLEFGEIAKKKKITSFSSDLNPVVSVLVETMISIAPRNKFAIIIRYCQL